MLTGAYSTMIHLSDFILDSKRMGVSVINQSHPLESIKSMSSAKMMRKEVHGRSIRLGVVRLMLKLKTAWFSTTLVCQPTQDLKDPVRSKVFSSPRAQFELSKIPKLTVRNENETTIAFTDYHKKNSFQKKHSLSLSLTHTHNRRPQNNNNQSIVPKYAITRKQRKPWESLISNPIE